MRYLEKHRSRLSEIELLPESELKAELGRRRSPDLRIKIPTSRTAEYQDQGWILDKLLTSSVWMRKPKTHHVRFEDQVWAMCARLGFTQLNKDRALRLSYGKGHNDTKQIDVLAVDDEVVLVIECKSSDKEQAPTLSFKAEIEGIQGYRAGLIANIRLQFPDHKVKFVLATNNINVSEDTLTRISNADIVHLDEEAVAYYHELAEHLGTAAKFQLLGNLFHGQQISLMDSTVAAIKGRMGGLEFYSFAIEPERLLKVAYVLHRNNANVQWMPTYQRIIKKARLKRVTSFVDEGGFFPNSLLVNIDNGKGKLKFEPTATQTSSSRMGVLHLPQKYRSVYIIDGQHRLYGFVDSIRASTELIPVIAFVDLPGEKQLELFMQINENQQAVPKNLRLTLKADLEWDSPDKKLAAQALKLKVAQLLGELKSSPLRGRIILGEEKPTDRMCITLDAVNRGIDRGRYIGEFTSTEMKRVGSFYRGSNKTTYKPLTDFLSQCFEFLHDELPGQWTIGRGDGGFVFTNAGAEALLRIIGDIVDHLIEQGQVDPRQNSASDVFVQVREYLQPLTQHLSAVSVDEISEYKSWFGSGGPTKYLRRFQTAIVNAKPEFKPDGYDDWLANQEKQFNQESFTMVRDIESHMKHDIRRRLEDRFRANWYKEGVPKAIFQEVDARRAAKQYDAADGVTVDWWDSLYLINYRDILLTGGMSQWTELYESDYSIQHDKKGSWKDKSNWVIRLNEIRNKVSHDGSVTEEEYGFLQEVHAHFDLGGTGRND